MISVLCLGMVACGSGESSQQQETSEIQAQAEQLVPRVERAVGLQFKSAPRVASRTTEQVRRYAEWQFEQAMSPGELDGIERTYRLFGLIPDSIDLRELMLDVLAEQVVGFYDPDSSTLYVVSGAEPLTLPAVMAHELVHALQDQYIDVDSLLDLDDNDRRRAAQAILEGQATLGGLLAMAPGTSLESVPGLINILKEQVRQQQGTMPRFASAPLIIRESLLFPYVAGAEFMSWLGDEYPGEPPFDRMPVSSEQVLHWSRYEERDSPRRLEFDIEDAVYSNNLGEFEIRVLIAHHTGNTARGEAVAAGWAGDRFVVLPSPEGDVLVWYTLWDTRAAASRFLRTIEPAWQTGEGRRAVIESTTLDGTPTVRIVDAPSRWGRWDDLPVPRLVD